MSAFKSKNRQTGDPRLNLLSRYNGARTNLLLVAIFSMINFVLLAAQSNTYFLFSAAIPYILTDLSMLLCGMYPEEYYEGMADVAVLPKGVFAIAAVIVICIILLYVLCYILSSKNRVGWLIAALVFFAIDTAVMFLWYEITVDIMLDIVFHIWIIVILSTGIAAHFKLQRLPEEPMPVFETAPDAPIAESDARVDSTMLRFADTEVKAKILLEFKAFEHSIVYRRVKKVNELVIDGKVYAEYTALLEKPHMLTANIDGHEIAVGLDSFGFSYATVDGIVAAKKLRLI